VNCPFLLYSFHLEQQNLKSLAFDSSHVWLIFGHYELSKVIFLKNRLLDRVQPEPAGNRDPGFTRVPPVPVSQNKEPGYPGSGFRFWPKTGPG
jgi:hypothetical protein